MGFKRTLLSLDSNMKTSIQQEQCCLGPTHFHYKRHGGRVHPVSLHSSSGFEKITRGSMPNVYHRLLLGLPRFVSNPPGRPAAERLTALPRCCSDRELQRCPLTRAKAAAGLPSSCPEGARGGAAGVSWGAAPAPGAFLKTSVCAAHLTRASRSSYSIRTCHQNEPLAVSERQLLAVIKRWQTRVLDYKIHKRKHQTEFLLKFWRYWALGLAAASWVFSTGLRWCPASELRLWFSKAFVHMLKSALIQLSIDVHT